MGATCEQDQPTRLGFANQSANKVRCRPLSSPVLNDLKSDHRTQSTNISELLIIWVFMNTACVRRERK